MPQDNIRVLCLATDNDRPEAEMLQKLHGASFKSKKIEIIVVIEPGSKHIVAFEKAGIEVIQLRASGKFSRQYISKIIELVKSKELDILHSFSKKTLSNAVLAVNYLGLKSPSTKIPKILAYRGIEGNLSLLDPGSWLTYFNPKVSKIVCVSHSIEKYLASYKVLKNKTITVHKGHDVSWYETKDLPTKSSLGLKETDFMLACVCNFRPRKGLKVLLEALSSLPAHVKLVLVGKLEEASLDALIKSNNLEGRVLSLGFQENAWRFAALSDVFVMPSLRREGLPKGVIEAMASGTPAVVTNVGGMPEIVEPEVSGFVVEPGSAKLLAAAISKYFENTSLLLSHSSSARARIKNSFNIKSSLDAYKSLYLDLTSS